MSEQVIDGVVISYLDIPTSVIKAVLDSTDASALLTELVQIQKYYAIYSKGAQFLSKEVLNYAGSNILYKQARKLINKEARFMFAVTPDFKIAPKGDLNKVTDDVKKQTQNVQNLVNEVMIKNKISQKLLKASKDCFIGKRVGWAINVNAKIGIKIVFFKANNFYYEYDAEDDTMLASFKYFVTTKESASATDRIIFCKEYAMNEEGLCIIKDSYFNGAGVLLEEPQYITTKFNYIPCGVILNDGLTGDRLGESEIEVLMDAEKGYNKIANSDIDAEAKSMNPIRYTTDMSSDSTRNLPVCAGSFWDLHTDMNTNDPKPSVGILAPTMQHSEPVKITLDRLKASMYDELDVPDINIETMAGTITSGKALKSIYWGLIVRCKEKMQTWSTELEQLVRCVVDSAMLYPTIAERYISEPLIRTNFEVEIVSNYALPDDEAEERALDMEEVASNLQSKSTYMKTWKGLTDAEVEEELKQIAKEREILEDSFMPETTTEEEVDITL